MYARHLVLISGHQGSGKTTTQNLLVETWNKLSSNHKAVAVNFAEPLYEMAEAVREIALKYGIPKKMPKDGPLLQLLGTDWGRATIDPEIWVKALKGKMELQSVKGGVFAYDQSMFVVGDCRFRNEFDAFPNALRVRIDCDEAVRKKRCSAWRENTAHPSEVDLNEYAEDGEFDMYFDSNLQPPQEIVTSVIETLKKRAFSL